MAKHKVKLKSKCNVITLNLQQANKVISHSKRKLINDFDKFPGVKIHDWDDYKHVSF